MDRHKLTTSVSHLIRGPKSLQARGTARGTLLTQWTFRRSALASAFAIPNVETPSSRAASTTARPSCVTRWTANAARTVPSQSSTRLLIVCHCYRRGDEYVRIISARKATKPEAVISPPSGGDVSNLLPR